MAEYFWRPQRRFYKRHGMEMEGQARACRDIGRGGHLEGRRLEGAQQFAVAMWFRAAVAFLVLFAIVGVIVASLPPAARRELSPVMLVPLVLMSVCLAEVIPLAWRRNWTASSATRRRRGLVVNPREERRGQPKARDFWIWLVLGIALVWVTFYGPTHWNH
ncbi:MAG TPA: hypothetical protein VGA61_15595 [Anaerolineae bacterium]